MKFEKVFNNKKYIRKIEGMGEGLVLFEISVVDKRIGQNYHLFSEGTHSAILLHRHRHGNGRSYNCR